jgi:hypothetical protein
MILKPSLLALDCNFYYFDKKLVGPRKWSVIR